jgi:hypothetical protein
MHTSNTTQPEHADLEKLATELAAHGFQAHLRTPPGRLPFLDVSNPRAAILTERVYAQADSFWWSWAERIAGCDEPATAAAILARVLRTVDAQQTARDSPTGGPPLRLGARCP